MKRPRNRLRRLERSLRTRPAGGVYIAPRLPSRLRRGHALPISLTLTHLSDLTAVVGRLYRDRKDRWTPHILKRCCTLDYDSLQADRPIWFWVHKTRNNDKKFSGPMILKANLHHFRNFAMSKNLVHVGLLSTGYICSLKVNS